MRGRPALSTALVACALSCLPELELVGDPCAGGACDPCAGGPDADEDGVPDACDRCGQFDDAIDADSDGYPDACDRCSGSDDQFESDGDLIPDGCDQCAGHDDRADRDGDAAPDGCDPCPDVDGPSAAEAPLFTATDGDETTYATVTNLILDGDRNVVQVAPNALVSVTLDYALRDCGCPGCINQIEIGFAPIPEGRPQTCAYNGVPGCPVPVTSSWAGNLVAPIDPGVYQVRFRRAVQTGCHGPDIGWYYGEPPAGTAVGVVCVAP